MHIWSLVTIGFVLSIAFNMIDRGPMAFNSFQPYRNLSASLLLSVLALCSRKVWIQLASMVGIFAIQTAPFLTWTLHNP